MYDNSLVFTEQLKGFIKFVLKHLKLNTFYNKFELLSAWSQGRNSASCFHIATIILTNAIYKGFL